MAKGWAFAFRQWLHRRLKPVPVAVLTRKNLYTFPNRLGAMFLMLVVVLWVLGTNYQNNLILALAYSLISVFVLAILHAFLNLAGVQLRWLKVSPTYAGQPLQVWLEVSTRRKAGCENLSLQFLGGEAVTLVLAAGECLKVPITCAPQTRGYCVPQALCVQSHYPLGMIRCWTWVKLQAEGVVFPAPMALDEPLSPSADNLNAWRAQTGLGDDFAGLKPYQTGDSLKKIAWKHWASGGDLYTKYYATPKGGDAWLDWAAIASSNMEVKLSGLCYWALQYHRQQKAFGLRLPGVEIPIALGEGHLQQCLTALAVFSKTPPTGMAP